MDSRLKVGVLGAVASLSFAIPAHAQTATDEEGKSYNGQDFTRPENSLETRLQFRSSDGDQSHTDREQIYLRYSTKAILGEGWKLGAFVQVPYTAKQISDENGGSTDTADGLDDITLQAQIVKSINAKWAYGVGLRLVTPTGAGRVGANAWQFAPGIGVRYTFTGFGGDSYFVPVVRYAIRDGTGRNLSEPQIAPTLNLGFSNRWFLTLFPSNDIRINFGDSVAGERGKLFLPIDAAVGKKIGDSLVTSLEVSAPVVDDYPVYKFKTELRIVMQFH